MSEYVFVADGHGVPDATPSPPTYMIITHRLQRTPISPGQTPPAESMPATSRARNSNGSSPGSESSFKSSTSPTNMQSVFSSQTGEPHRSQQHSSQEWDVHKEDIRRLYLEENRPLKEVMAIMRQRGFRATVRMYKSRFDKWGFSKNNSKKEVIAMLQLARQRNALGKRTAFQRNGKEVAIDAYLKRKGISQYDLAEPGLPEEFPDHLRCVTPPPETLVTIQAGGTLSLQELVLQCTRDLAWLPYCPADFPLVTPAAMYRGDKLRCAITDLTNADWLFHNGEFERGGTMCEEGFKSLHLMVQRPSVYGLMHLFQVLLDAGNRGIVKEVWRYLAAYSSLMRSDGPLAKLFQGIFRMLETHEYDEYWNFILECAEKLLLVDEQQTGLPEGTVARLYPLVFIPRARHCRRDAIERLQSRCDWSRLEKTSAPPRGPEEATVFSGTELLIEGSKSNWKGDRVVELAETILENVKGFAYNTEFFETMALTAMAHHYRNEYDDIDVDAIGDELHGAEAERLPDQQQLESPPVSVNAAGRTRRMEMKKQRIKEKKEKHELSTAYLDRSTRLMEGRWDPDLGYMIDDLQKLESWYREAGDDRRADEVRARFRQALDIIPKKWERGNQGILF